MSYSFGVSERTKDAAIAAIGAAFDNVVVQQPQHAVDRDGAVNAATAFVSGLRDPSDDEGISVSMYGSVSWGEDGKFGSIGGSISASIISMPAEASAEASDQQATDQQATDQQATDQQATDQSDADQGADQTGDDTD